MASKVLDLKVDKMTKLEKESKVKAFCDLAFGNLFSIKGFRVVEGEKGIFVGMPQQRSLQGKWFDVFLPATGEIRAHIEEFVLQAYRKEG